MSNNIDILTLHNKMLKIYNEYKNDLKIYIKKYETLLKLLDENLPDTTKKKIRSQVNSLEKFIDDISNNKSMNYYIMESLEIINTYTKEEFKKHLEDIEEGERLEALKTERYYDWGLLRYSYRVPEKSAVTVCLGA